MNHAQVVVTTSWDDGHALDQKLAAVLAEYGFAATFYISPRCREIPPRQRLASSGLVEIARQFEVGNHTLTHPHLPRLPLSEAAREILSGKDELEQAIGQPVTSFCYPYGAYRPEHIGLVRKAGFEVARTIRRYCFDRPADAFQLGTTTHAARYKADAWPAFRRSTNIGQAVSTWANWDVLARQLFDQASATGGLYHLWGHSWEIEAHHDWSRLRSVLGYIAQHDNVVYLTNGALCSLS